MVARAAGSAPDRPAALVNRRAGRRPSGSRDHDAAVRPPAERLHGSGVAASGEALDAEIGASRPVIDSGWLPKVRQIGKSGANVTPKLYLSLGVSGAPEHVEGMQGSELIVAINKDPGAAIFNVADYGVVADLFDIADELTEVLGG